MTEQELNKKRRKELMAILQMSKQFRHSGDAFHTPLVLGVICAILASIGTERFHLSFGPLPSSLVALVVGAIVGWAMGRVITQGRKPLSARIFEALANYDPIDKANYRRLQERAAEYEATPEAIWEWLLCERAAIEQRESPGPSETDEARKLFVTKQPL